MAIENKDVITEVGTEASHHTGAAGLRTAIVIFEVAAADDDASVYRLMNIASESIISNLLIGNDAITAGTDYDIGFYKKDLGAVVDADELADGLDLSSAHASGSELSGISAVDVANRTKKIWELLGLTQLTKEDTYDLAITANTVGSAAGTICAIVEYIIA